MNFHIDVPTFLSTLPVMLYGMIGGMLVMLLICGILVGLHAIGKRGEKRKENNA